MEVITRETFRKWVAKNNWIQVNEADTINGRQDTYITPSGNMVIVIYDIKGNLHSVGQPVPTSANIPGMPAGFRGR